MLGLHYPMMAWELQLRLLAWAVAAPSLAAHAAGETTTVPILFGCEFTYRPQCCALSLASAKIAIEDANAKNGSIVPALGATTGNVQVQLIGTLDSSDKSSIIPDLLTYFKSDTPPVAIIGPSWSSRITHMSQVCNAVGVPLFAWGTSASFFGNDMYAGVFRVVPPDNMVLGAVHQFMAMKNVTAGAVFVSTDDLWGESISDELKRLCAVSNHKCTFTTLRLNINPTPAEIEQVVNDLYASGLTFIVNVLMTWKYEVMEAAYRRNMAGDKAPAEGYVWTSADVATLGEWHTGKPFVWSGYIAFGQTNGGAKDDKWQLLLDTWKSRVPHMEIPFYLSMADAHYPADQCAFYVTSSFECVARLRGALEGMNFSTPSKPGKRAADDWWGKQLRQLLQDPGVKMDGLIEGPDWRRSHAPGLPWQESVVDYKLFNIAADASGNVETLHAYTSQSGGLVEGPDFGRGVTAGNVALNSNFVVGQLKENACNGGKDLCSSQFNFGMCQPDRAAFRSPGWCHCEDGFVGRFCSIETTGISLPPQEVVPVGVGLKLVEFGGLDKVGTEFTVDLDITMSWKDSRFAFDAGVYRDAETVDLLKGKSGAIWLPSFNLGNVPMNMTGQGVTLTVERVDKPEVNGFYDDKKNIVTLTIKQTRTVQKSVKPMFREFPFDSHELHVDLKTGGTDVSVYRLLDEGEFIPDRLDAAWNAQWPQVNLPGEISNGVFAVKTEDGRTVGFHMDFRVERATTTTVWRVLVPLQFLVVCSWSGFWIVPGQLMPRFASAFISFLTLNTFRSVMQNMMPKDGELGGMSWIDVYLSIVGVMMGAAVLQNVAVQFVNHSISPSVAHHIDVFSRWSFPLVYIFLFMVMLLFNIRSLRSGLGMTIDDLVVVIHAILVAFVMVLVTHALVESAFFPILYLRRAVKTNLSGSSRHREHKLTDFEMHRTFDILAKRSEKDDVPQGHVKLECMTQWFLSASSHLRKKEPQVRELIANAVDGHDVISYPIFTQSYNALIKQCTLILYDRLEDAARENAQLRTSLRVSRRGVAVSGDFNGDFKTHDSEPLEPAVSEGGFADDNSRAGTPRSEAGSCERQVTQEVNRSCEREFTQESNRDTQQI